MTEERYIEILSNLGSPEDEGGWLQVIDQAAESDLSDEELLAFLDHHGVIPREARECVRARKAARQKAAH
jgi:hypothetical protein